MTTTATPRKASYGTCCRCHAEMPSFLGYRITVIANGATRIVQQTESYRRGAMHRPCADARLAEMGRSTR